MKILQQVWLAVSVLCALFSVFVLLCLFIPGIGRLAGHASLVKRMVDVPETKVKYSYQTPDTASFDKTLKGLKEREQLVGEKEKKLQEKEKQIAEMEKELAGQRSLMTEIQESVKSMLVELQLSEKKNIKKLANVYSLMSADDAVSIIEELDDATIVQILSLMKERKAAALMGAFAQTGEKNAARAARISVMLQKLVTVSAE